MRWRRRTTSTSETTSASATPTTSSGSGAPTTSTESGALTAEAQQAAAGDIPDNQVFLTFRNTAAGYSIKYPEGWAQRGSAARVTFQDKNNLVRIDVAEGATQTVAAVRARCIGSAADAVAELRGARTSTVNGHAGGQGDYSTAERPEPGHGQARQAGRRSLLRSRGRASTAVVDLGTPEGVDNVDAYRLMIESFRWS